MHSLAKSIAVAAVAATAVAAAQSADARQWNATPAALAQDYAQIIDTRSDREIVLVLWIAPQILPDNPENQAARDILARYLLVATVHADVSTVGTMSFRPPAEIVLHTDSGDERAPLDDGAIPPAAFGMMTAMQRVFTQSLGNMGAGTHWVTFDGAGVDGCGPGVFWIEFAGEKYDYQTPIPGCQ